MFFTFELIFLKTEDIVLLEAIRYIKKIKPGKNINFYEGNLG